MAGWGLGKERSRLGRWLDQRGITQQWLSRETELNRATISRIASDDEYTPNLRTVQKIIKALKKVDPRVSQDDFWM
ncbi:helix-turn-helix transcriptional regulator [Brevibacillus centrosporus]|uniref:helix-turn-helix domain-containing protein n=1 Tax=Brevibacillus centrosporus TaxID=54910 RepID=UPI002E223AD4|nr:helix-turn-helix transcriptional regulator [Brevibacillus centrosporus]